MPPQKRHTVFVVVIISAALLGGHLLPGFDNSRVDDGFRNGLHVLFFAIATMVIFEYLVRSGVGKIVASLLLVTLVAAIGGAAEFLQFLSGRQPDLMDILRDIAGASLALIAAVLWHWSDDGPASRGPAFVARFFSAVAGVLIVTPMAFWLFVMLLGRMSSPVILDFEQWWNQYTYDPINAVVKPRMGETGFAEIELMKRRRSGLIVSPIVHDWGAYEFLIITAGMAVGPDTNVTVKINDRARRNNWSDQFLASIVVNSNVRLIRIPLRDLAEEPGQAMIDLSDVQELMIFARDRRRDDVMIIENIRLE